MAIKGLTAQQAAWKPSPQRHSVWQIVRHVTHWKRFLLEAWDGKQPDPEAYGAADWQDAGGEDTAWRADVESLHAVSRQIAERVRDAGDEDLLQPIPGWKKPAAVDLIEMGTHDIYHAGQIQYIRALQGV
jgi:uncharacterized damage-inducible protein DinB